LSSYRNGRGIYFIGFGRKIIRQLPLKLVELVFGHGSVDILEREKAIVSWSLNWPALPILKIKRPQEKEGKNLMEFQCCPFVCAPKSPKYNSPLK